ncbi:transmembrane channel-like protein 7 [Clarias magur]|uniref:Transmembrane channel-like protein n=1 Tax=Clarias magur TaxID=1594786 RepID=A0A8J4UBH2_CLAMG|nr:transmembrane channel-like protein 7 [Clarias magur]
MLLAGRFGVGVKAYFVFLRYLLCLNFISFAIIAGSVISPSLYKRPINITTTWNKSLFLDVFLGSGFMEDTPVFYGFYKNVSFGTKCLNTAFFFFLGMLIMLLLNLIMIVRRTVVGYKHTWLTGIHFNANMSYKVFCGWDFCIREPEAATLKHSLIRNELKMDLEEQRFRQKVLSRSLKQRVLLHTLRVILNFVVLVLLGSSFYLIYFATTELEKYMTKKLHWTLELLFSYRSPITITIVNSVMPQIFSSITVYEDYSLSTQLNVTLVRSILLKLGSLAMYIFFLKGNDSSKCAETEFGKEMYKLTIFHALATFCNTFLVAFPRKFLVEKCLSSNFLKKVGKQQFVIPLRVLDLVYSQTVTWMGVFYCPLLPAISILKLLAIFYISKFNLVRCCDPAKKMFRTTSSSVLFNFLLLLGLIMSVVTFGVNIVRYRNDTTTGYISRNCGPFPGNESVYIVASNCVNTFPPAAQESLRYITSEAFAYTLILTEIIILTFYMSRGRANKKAMERLRDMLVMCSSDKRYLVKHHATLLRKQKKNIKRSQK